LNGGLFRVLGLNEALEARQVRFPESAVLIEPGINGAKRLGVELVNAMAALAVFTYQVGATKQFQMF
jgi:hypothetical protein